LATIVNTASAHRRGNAPNWHSNFLAVSLK